MTARDTIDNNLVTSGESRPYQTFLIFGPAFGSGQLLIEVRFPIKDDPFGPPKVSPEWT